MKLKQICISAAFLFLSSMPSLSLAANGNTSIITHSITQDNLVKLNGRYMDEKLAAKQLKPQLKKLLGARYKDFDAANRVQSPMEIKNGILVTWGMMPHSGGNPTAMSFFGSKGKLLAILKTDDQFEYFGDITLLENPAVKAAIAN